MGVATVREVRRLEGEAPAAWLPAGKRAAVCFSIDDVHPGTSPGCL